MPALKRLQKLTCALVLAVFVLTVLCLSDGLMPQALAAKKSGKQSQVKSQTSLLRVRAVTLDPVANALVVHTNQPVASQDRFTVLKLMNPYRLVIDIPDADLAVPPVKMPINQQGIESVDMARNHTPFYSAVRLTVGVKDYETLNRMNAMLVENRLEISLKPGSGDPLAAANNSQTFSQSRPADVTSNISPGSVPESPSTSSAYPLGMNVVGDVYFRDDKLVIKGLSGRNDEFVIKSRFNLSQPTRLVVDLNNAMLAGKQLLTPILVNSNGIRQVRLGQFDENTVRLVIETDNPDAIQAYYPATDKAQLALTTVRDVDVSALPSTTQLGELQQVALDQEGGNTVLRLQATSSIIHRVTRTDDKIVLEMLNVAARPGWIGYDKNHFPQIEKMYVENLSATQPNSKVVLNLGSGYDNLKYASHLIDNGKTLELVLFPGGAAVSSSVSLTKGSKAPFPARIVVDAGHGGKDNGAMRSGYLEKDLNLEVALKLRTALEARGLKVYMTRSTDEFLPLSTITAKTNSIRPDLFVSIHHNASTNPGLNGIETYYYTNQSIPLARKIHQQLANSVDAPDRGVRKAMFYVIHHTSVPAVLCELGYVSNPGELQAVASDRRQAAEVNAIADGVVEYLKSRLSASAAK